MGRVQYMNLSDDEFQKLLEEFERAHLKSWDSQRDEMLQRKKEDRNGFEQRLRERWGVALDEYEVVVEVARIMGGQYAQRWFYPANASGDARTVSLIELHARCLRVAQEVLALLYGGFAIGAQARARTMHELAVVAFFISANSEDVAHRYREYAVVERYKRALEYNRVLPKAYAHLGYKPIEDETLRTLTEQRTQLKDKYGKEFLNASYGWAAAALDKAKPTFRDLEEAVNMDHLRPFYAWSSQDIHPGSHGNELNYLQRGSGRAFLSAGASNAYLADPASSAMNSLSQTTAALCLPVVERASPYDSCTVVEVGASLTAQVSALQKLVDKAQQTFLEAHQELEEDEARVWREPPQGTSDS